jgi:hypothetical protein
VSDNRAGERVAVHGSADAFGLFLAVLESMGEAVFVVRPSDRLPVLFVSGYSADVLEKHGVDPDHIRILQKPFDPQTLVRAVLETLRG